MLCRRSASLISSTRQSSAMATSILRMVAACCASLESNWRRSSLVTPSTTRATPVTEGVADPLEREPGVLHGVVQERGRHRLLVQAQLGDDRRHRHGVGDVRLAGPAELPFVGLLGHPPRRHDHRGVVLGPVRRELDQQRGQEVAEGPLLCLLGLDVERPSFRVSGRYPGQGHHPSSVLAWGNAPSPCVTGGQGASGHRPRFSGAAFPCSCAGAVPVPGAGTAADGCRRTPAWRTPTPWIRRRRGDGPSPPSRRRSPSPVG